MTVLPKADLERVCSYYETYCGNLQSASILISGVTGFVGSWLLESLVSLDREFDLNISLTGISRELNKAQEMFREYAGPNLRFIETDVSKKFEVDGGFSHIFHAATPTTLGTRAGSLSNVYESSVLGARKLIYLAKLQRNTPVFVHTSSGAVYGDQPTSLERLPLTWPRQVVLPSNGIKNEYARAKIDTEVLIESATNEEVIKGINARLFAFMGPRIPLTEHFAIGNFVYSGMHDDTIKIAGDGQSVRSYQSASDMVSQLIYVLSTGTSGNYHVGSTDGRKILDWANLVGLVCGKPVEILGTDTSAATRYVPEADLRVPDGLGESISKSEHLERWIAWLRS
jgi:dTDP-glucose 4,6-dehydratase